MTEEHEHSHYHGVDRAEEHLSVGEAIKKLTESVTPVKPETISALKANNRVLFEDVRSPVDLPKRARSTRDGYSVCIPQDVEAGQSFKITGEVEIGSIPKVSVRNGEAVRVATGSYIPKGANAVVMVEYAEVQGDTLRVNNPIKVSENLLRPGEDIANGQLLLARGARIYPQHVALFSMLGIRKLKVFSKPDVAFFSTGDELVDAGKPNARSIATGIYDATRPFIASVISDLGGIPIDLGIARDNFDQIRAKMVKGLRYDALILSAGSSVGEKDFAARAAMSIKGVKILAHGVAMRPSSPTGIASYKGKPILLLPGFPTSAIISFFVFAMLGILKLSGSANLQPIKIKARLTEEYGGKLGLTHFVRVRVKRENGEYLASITKPTEAQYSSWLSSSNGVAIIGENGVAVKGELVDVFPIGEIASS
jgi:molybdenum cofactor synthesis domain-containing protein